MRIISGRFKGRRLVSFKADIIRPTTDRVKESMFNILQGHWEDARVLDLFSGTGNLGIEALSRGAAHVEMVEKNPKSLAIISENLNTLNIQKEIRVHRKDVFAFIKTHQSESYDVIIIDPPFTEAISHDVMEAVSQSTLWAANTWIVIESSSHERLEGSYGPLVCVDTRDFGDKIMSIFQRKQE